MKSLARQPQSACNSSTGAQAHHVAEGLHSNDHNLVYGFKADEQALCLMAPDEEDCIRYRTVKHCLWAPDSRRVVSFGPIDI